MAAVESGPNRHWESSFQNKSAKTSVLFGHRNRSTATASRQTGVCPHRAPMCADSVEWGFASVGRCPQSSTVASEPGHRWLDGAVWRSSRCSAWQSVEVSDTTSDGLTEGETRLLIGGLSDDVAFVWALIDLGIRANPPVVDEPPSTDAIAAAFGSLERLVGSGLVRIGRIEYVNPAQPAGTVAPVKHVEEALQAVRERVERACHVAESNSDWAFSCWLVNTDAGDAIARLALDRGK